ncbi:MAG: tetratricopeptide repeat protein [Lewinellaceae bacterium]|nr:tetratricopeptide repeat protein [Saprospiraceae bacterium]MCB9270791.1 tetratricopeptide repeat protein [Lewinellaceae bacterium]HPG05839.1 tetratricopeptide repeat protein [Saprospiraceae bacterium]HQU52588.1 tetratricopeptide repeat protein [Saprospiraceae bacterium]
MQDLFYKSIFQGYLQFRNAKSYQKMLDMYNYRVENFYKNELALKESAHFDEEKLSYIVPRTVVQVTKKAWRNTVGIFEYLAEFAISGSIGAWMVDEGTILEAAMIEPVGDKIAVQAFLRGRALSDEEGSENEAIKALTEAIEKFDKHAQAYERRGYVNMRLGNWEDAHYDFSKSLRLDEGNSYAYIGRAHLYMQKKQYKEAIADLRMATTTSIALQPIYWTATRMRAQCYAQSNLIDKALFDYKLFVNRDFPPDHPNYKWLKYACFQYAKLLHEQNKNAEALKVVEKGEKLKNAQHPVDDAEWYLLSGEIKKALGVAGYASDFEKAASAGSKQANALLSTLK